MNTETVFLYLIAGAAFVFALWNGLSSVLMRGRTARTTGTIFSITSPNPATAKARNSKWAKVSYKVNGRSYTSRNRMQVPMTAQLGTPVTVRYDIEQPEKIYSFSLKRMCAGLLVASVCAAAAVFLR